MHSNRCIVALHPLNPVIIGNFVLFFRRGLSLAYHDSVRQIGGHTTLIPAASVPKALAVAVRIAELKPSRHFKRVEAVSPRQMKPERNEMVTRSVTKAQCSPQTAAAAAGPPLTAHRSNQSHRRPTSQMMRPLLGGVTTPTLYSSIRHLKEEPRRCELTQRPFRSRRRSYAGPSLAITQIHPRSLTHPLQIIHCSIIRFHPRSNTAPSPRFLTNPSEIPS